MAMYNPMDLNTVLQYIVAQPLEIFNKHTHDHLAEYRLYALATAREKDKTDYTTH
jgi:hypothetical protein